MTELGSRFIMTRRYLLVASKKKEILWRSGVHDSATRLHGRRSTPDHSHHKENESFSGHLPERTRSVRSRLICFARRDPFLEPGKTGRRDLCFDFIPVVRIAVLFLH